MYSVQAKGDLEVNKSCRIFVKIGKHKRSVNFIMCDTSLEYTILGLE